MGARGGLLAAALLVAWPAIAFADPARERELAEQVVQGWPDPYPNGGLSRGARFALQQLFGSRMTPYAWAEAEVAYTPAIVTWADLRPHAAKVYVEEFSESELELLAAFVASPAFKKIAPIILAARAAEEPREDVERRLAAALTSEEIVEVAERVVLLNRARARLVQASGEFVRQFEDQFVHVYRSRLMARCPGRTQPLPWCER